MKTVLRIAVFASVLLMSVAATRPQPVTLAEVQTHPGLQLHRVHYRLDENGGVWLAMHFVNGGSGAVTVNAVSPGRWGPWTAVHQTVEHDGMIRPAMKIAGEKPDAVWVDSSQGLIRFALPGVR